MTTPSVVWPVRSIKSANAVRGRTGANGFSVCVCANRARECRAPTTATSGLRNAIVLNILLIAETEITATIC